MSKPLAITEGEPLTYGFIKSMIDRINLIDSQLNTVENKQSVRIIGNQIKGADVVILADDESFDRSNENTSIEKEIKFSQGVFSDPPTVVATLADAADRKDDKLKTPAYATLTIGKVTKESFTIILQFVKSSQNNNKIKINYVAIGKAKK